MRLFLSVWGESPGRVGWTCVYRAHTQRVENNPANPLLSLNRVLCSTALANRLVSNLPSISHSLPPIFQKNYKHTLVSAFSQILRIQTWGLMIGGQGLFPLSHLHSPQSLFEGNFSNVGETCKFQFIFFTVTFEILQQNL